MMPSAIRARSLCDAIAQDGVSLAARRRSLVAERGIAQNRNALVAAALDRSEMQFLAMLDDDEWVEPDWLDALLATQAHFGADAVEGPVIGVLDRGAHAASYGGVATPSRRQRRRRHDRRRGQYPDRARRAANAWRRRISIRLSR